MKNTLKKMIHIAGAVTMMITAVLLFTGATAWEGVTSVDAKIPGSYGVATNSYPRNSVVDITNLENNKMVRVRVVSGIDTSGLLAALSPSAADALGLSGSATCRIRMTQPPDDIAFSNYRLGPIVTPELAETTPSPAEPVETSAAPIDTTEAVIAPAIAEALSPEPASVPAAEAEESRPLLEPMIGPIEDSPPALAERPEAEESRSLLEPMIAPIEDSPAMAEDTLASDALASAEPVQIPDNPVLVSASERLPEAADQPVLPPENFVSPIEAADASASVTTTAETPPSRTTITDYAHFVAPITGPADASASAETAAPAETDAVAAIPPETIPVPAETAYINTADVIPANPEYAPSSDFAPFHAPLIEKLEQGMWYVQVGAFTRAEHVEDEISRIGTAYPVAVQNAGTGTAPTFRLLLGPLNQGESGAMLQRLKSIGYKTAFIRRN